MRAARQDRVTGLQLNALHLSGERRDDCVPLFDPGFALLIDRDSHRPNRDDAQVH